MYGQKINMHRPQFLHTVISGGNEADKEGIEPFFIDKGSGVITTQISLDRETRSQYQLCVTVNKDPNFSFRLAPECAFFHYGTL